MKTRVLVVDDSAVMRGLLTELIKSAPDMEVVGGAPDAASAREMIKVLNPDVLTLDVNMPGMGGFGHRIAAVSADAGGNLFASFLIA